jgi:hypothetical protein
MFATTFSTPPTEEFVKKVASISLKYDKIDLLGYSSQYNKNWGKFLYFSSKLDAITSSGIAEIVDSVSAVHKEYIENLKIPLNEYEYQLRTHIDRKQILEKLSASYDGISLNYNRSLPEDHISSEMIFMAHLRGITRYHLENDDIEGFFEAIVQQQLFYKEHIATWAHFFTYLISNIEEKISFYKQIGEIMGLFLKEDTLFLQRLMMNNGGFK